MPRYTYLLILHTLITACTINSAMAESPRWYEVELALISYQDKQKISHEHWPEILIADDLSSDPTTTALDTNKATNSDPWSWLEWWNQSTQPRGLFDIQKEAQVQPPLLEKPFLDQGLAFASKQDKFAKAKDLQLIWSKKWRQPIPDKSKAELDENQIIIDIKTALNFKQAVKNSSSLIEIEVSGKLYLYRSRYLHLVTDLNVQHWQSLEANSEFDNSIKILPYHSKNEDNIIPSASSTPLTKIIEIPLRAASIKQSRRMRSNELHYIDHPMLGILVRTTPIE